MTGQANRANLSGVAGLTDHAIRGDWPYDQGQVAMLSGPSGHAIRSKRACYQGQVAMLSGPSGHAIRDNWLGDQSQPISGIIQYNNYFIEVRWNNLRHGIYMLHGFLYIVIIMYTIT